MNDVNSLSNGGLKYRIKIKKIKISFKKNG